MKLIISGGGTGGHINPAVAIANEFKKRDENNKVLFIGTKHGLEKKLVPEEGYNIKFIDVEGFQKKNSPYNICVLAKFAKGILNCIKILKEEKPDIVVGTGGYVSAPVVFAANLLKIPTVIHEQNIISGKTNKMLSKKVSAICSAFDNRNILGYPEKTYITGNPIRAAFKNKEFTNAKENLGLNENIPFVLCVSGSLGAMKVNECITDLICNSDIKYNLLVVTGDMYYGDVIQKLKENNVDINKNNIYVKNYINDMDKYLSAADVIISRSGAIFLSEIAYLKKPSILIPSPNVAENHQEKNADRFVKAGASLKISEKDLTWEKLKDTIDLIVNDDNRRLKMAESAKLLSINDSEKRIVDIMYNLLK